MTGHTQMLDTWRLEY